MSETDDLLDLGTTTSSNSDNNKDLPNATAVLVLGIISIVGCLFYAVPGIVCGIIALSLYKKDLDLYTANPALYGASYKNSRAGYVCGIIGLSLSSVYFLVLFFMITMMLTH